jgi:hypothetical protein
LEDLSDASFFGKLLVLQTNVRLDWKVIARYKHSSLMGLIIGDEEKKFYNTGTWCSIMGRSKKVRLPRLPDDAGEGQREGHEEAEDDGEAELPVFGDDGLPICREGIQECVRVLETRKL